MPYSSSFSLDSIVLIESLPSGELRTGTDLFETTIAPRCASEQIYGELFSVRSKDEVLEALRSVENLARRGRSPILHLEMHGDEVGLQVASGERISWPELAPLLARINEAARMNLLVVAAACNGWYLTEVLRPTGRAPAWGIIGPPESVRGDELYEAMKRFYSSLLPELDVTRAMYALNRGAEINEWVYRLISADLLYCYAFRGYLQGLVEDESQAARVNRLVVEAANGTILDVNQSMQMRAQFRTALDQHEFWYEKFKTGFLMLDLFPENAGRFPLTLTDCQPRSA